MDFKDHIGVDVGSDNVRICQVARVGNGFRLLAFGTVALPEGLSGSESKADIEKIGGIVRKLAKDIGATSNKAAIALPESQVFTRVIDMPVLSEAELESAIAWEAEQYVPVPLADVLLRHKILSIPEKVTPESKMDVLLVAAPHGLVEKYMRILKFSGLDPVAVETEIFAISRALVGSDPYSPTSLVVNLGATTTDLSVVNHGSLAFVRSIATGGNAVTRSVSTDLNLDVSQAEEYKRVYGLDQSKLDGKVYTSVKTIVDVIVTEIKRALVYYQGKKSEDPVKRVVLSGGMAKMHGIVDYFGQALTLEVQVGNPVANISKTEQQTKTMLDDGPLYTTGIGLAVREG